MNNIVKPVPCKILEVKKESKRKRRGEEERGEAIFYNDCQCPKNSPRICLTIYIS